MASLTVASLSAGSPAMADCLVEDNTCYGTDVLFSNTSSHYNSGFGYRTLYSNTSGMSNTAIGYSALYLNDTGGNNTAIGASAMLYNTAGYSNTASGDSALNANTTGSYNTATGAAALRTSTTGDFNTATGYSALNFNTEGYANTAIGTYSLQVNATGYYNTATGMWALGRNERGNSNTANGVGALYNAKGNRNVALGYYAGRDITSGPDNITIGTLQKGKASDSGVIRIGSSVYQKRAFVAGIRGVKTGKTGAVPVLIDANGQLGTINSSRRVKEDIQPMGDVSARLLDLKPVTFRYREAYEDGSKPVQFGLIAEDVAEVFPELVVRDADGAVETVSYHLLSTLLVNELQKEHRVNEAQAERIASLEAQVAEIAELKTAMAGMARKLGQLDRAGLRAAN